MTADTLPDEVGFSRPALGREPAAIPGAWAGRARHGASSQFTILKPPPRSKSDLITLESKWYLV